MSQHQQDRKNQNPIVPNSSPNPLQDTRSADQLLREMQEEVSPEAAPLWQFVLDNAPKIAFFVVTLVVLIAGYAFYQGYQENVLAEAKQELSLITSRSDASERMASLESFKQDAPSDLYIAIDFAIAEAAMIEQDFAKAQAAYTSIMDADPSDALGFSAGINVGDIMLRRGKAAEAIKVYESLIANSAQELHILVYLRVAEAAESANMNDRAIQAYEDVIASLPPTAMSEATYFRMRIKSLS